MYKHSMGVYLRHTIFIGVTLLGLIEFPLNSACQNGGAMFTISSSAFKNNETIPQKYTGLGDDISPELNWSGAPENTKEFAIICDDPDAPTAEPWVHWVIYGISGSTKSLPVALPQQQHLKTAGDVIQGLNSWNTIGYRGPLPPSRSGKHHYHFSIFALDKALGLKPGLSKNDLLKQLDGHVISTSTITGVYSR